MLAALPRNCRPRPNLAPQLFPKLARLWSPDSGPNVSSGLPRSPLPIPSPEEIAEVETAISESGLFTRSEDGSVWIETENRYTMQHANHANLANEEPRHND